jgi:hypothetical protein
VIEGDRYPWKIQLGKWIQGESNGNEVNNNPSKELAYLFDRLGIGN